MNNKMITIPYADAIEYGENTSALFKALWELTDLIRLESDLKKHHRAYLHVREDIDERVKEARQIMTKVSVDMIGFYFKVCLLYTSRLCGSNKTARTMLSSPAWATGQEQTPKSAFLLRRGIRSVLTPVCVRSCLLYTSRCV